MNSIKKTTGIIGFVVAIFMFASSAFARIAGPDGFTNPPSSCESNLDQDNVCDSQDGCLTYLENPKLDVILMVMSIQCSHLLPDQIPAEGIYHPGDESFFRLCSQHLDDYGNPDGDAFANACDPDADNDGIANWDEIAGGTDPFHPDDSHTHGEEDDSEDHDHNSDTDSDTEEDADHQHEDTENPDSEEDNGLEHDHSTHDHGTPDPQSEDLNNQGEDGEEIVANGGCSLNAKNLVSNSSSYRWIFGSLFLLLIPIRGIKNLSD